MPEENTTPQSTQTPPVDPTPAVSISDSPQKGGKLLKVAFLSICGLGFMLGVTYIIYVQLSNQPRAMVNGTPITQAMLGETKKLLIDGASEQGVNLEDPETMKLIEDQAFKIAIQNTLIKTKALEKNITADPKVVQERFDMIQKQVSENPEMKARMESVGLAGDNLKAKIEEQMITELFLLSETDIESITVTEDDIKLVAERMRAQYASVETPPFAGGEGDQTQGGDGEVVVNQLPSEEEIMKQIETNRAQIENQIRIEKQQQIFQAFIAKLEAESKIETY